MAGIEAGIETDLDTIHEDADQDQRRAVGGRDPATDMHVIEGRGHAIEDRDHVGEDRGHGDADQGHDEGQDRGEGRLMPGIGGLGQEVEGHDQDDGQGREEGHLIETLTDDVDTGHPRLIGEDAGAETGVIHGVGIRAIALQRKVIRNRKRQPKYQCDSWIPFHSQLMASHYRIKQQYPP